MLVLVAAALLGVVLTLLTGHDPGFLLGFFVVIGAIVAMLGVRRGAIYLFFPLPALILFLSALVVGAVHDRSLETTNGLGVGVGFLQWVAGVFFPMCIATAVTLVIGGARWLLGRQLVTGNYAPPPANTRPAPGARRPLPSDPWSDDPPRAARPAQSGPNQNGTGPRPGGNPWQDVPRPSRDQRDQRANRDPWGDPRLPSPPPADQRPRDGRPAPQFQPRDPTAQGDRTTPRPAQGDRTAPRPAQGDPWDQSTRPVRPPRPPRDPRDQR